MAKVIKKEVTMIEFEEDEFPFSENEMFEVTVEDGKVVLTPYAEIEIDLKDFDRRTLEHLVKESCERNVSVNDVMTDILKDFLNERDQEHTTEG
jgi:hypothetical protein